jgi:hypothetical protein
MKNPICALTAIVTAFTAVAIAQTAPASGPIKVEIKKENGRSDSIRLETTRVRFLCSWFTINRTKLDRIKTKAEQRRRDNHTYACAVIGNVLITTRTGS